MDALSETLRVVRLTAAIFLEGRWLAPWCFASPPAAELAPVLEPTAERVVVFHVVTEGRCIIEHDEHPPLQLEAGDVAFLPHGDGHRLASQKGLRPSYGPSAAQLLSHRPFRFKTDDAGDAAGVVCGYLACDAKLADLLLMGLDPVVRVRVRDTAAGRWLESSLDYALCEVDSPRPGGDSVLAKLAELLFIEVLRTYLNQHDGSRTGWLAGVRDPVVGRALTTIHRRPEHAWTLEALAKEAGTSRSVLAERFQQIVGTSPIQYLAHWRMVLAANLLTQSQEPLARIAERVGYQTDTAFSRAFRREYGVPPAAWRRQRHQAGC